MVRYAHTIYPYSLEKIRANTNKGLAVGHDRFKDEIELLTGRRVKEKGATFGVAKRKEIILL